MRPSSSIADEDEATQPLHQSRRSDERALWRRSCALENTELAAEILIVERHA